MKACTEFQALLDLFLDGELSDEEIDQLQQFINERRG